MNIFFLRQKWFQNSSDIPSCPELKKNSISFPKVEMPRFPFKTYTDWIKTDTVSILEFKKQIEKYEKKKVTKRRKKKKKRLMNS